MSALALTEERLDQLASFIFANAEAIRENAEAIRENAKAIRESNQRMTGFEQLAQSNSRAIQALADRIAEIALVQEEAAEERRELREATVRLEGVAEGIANLRAFFGFRSTYNFAETKHY